MSVMWRKWECLGCGYSHESRTSYYRHAKVWNTVHTSAYCKARKSHPATLGKMSVA